MPKKYDRCVRKVKKQIKTGKIPKTYKANGRKKTSAHAICRARIKNTPKRRMVQVTGTKNGKPFKKIIRTTLTLTALGQAIKVQRVLGGAVVTAIKKVK